ncbi:hypothetical protein C4D07_RS24805, partial [Vibrio parahaemolyticus]|nr:hypothetical protein [Vibrio parahaemolyticus]
VRYDNGEFKKYIYQYFRLVWTYFIFFFLKKRKLLTVSQEDLLSLKRRFPNHDISYLNHPIQMQVIEDIPNNSVAKKFRKLLFVNLQDFYSCSSKSFFNGAFSQSRNSLTLGFHGSNAEKWKMDALNVGYENVSSYGFVDDFACFIKGYDAIVMPLSAGAGIKNIMLNSVYLRVVVFGTKEAFSGVPENLSSPFIISNMSELESKLIDENITDIIDKFNELRDYIIQEHNVVKFSSKVLK